MKPKEACSPHLLPFVTLLLLVQKSLSEINPNYVACKPFECGNLSINYPFYVPQKQPSLCGSQGFEVACNPQKQAIMSLSGDGYIVNSVSYEDLSVNITNSAFSGSVFGCLSASSVHNLSFDPDSQFSFARGKHLEIILGIAFSGLSAIILVAIIFRKRIKIKCFPNFPSTRNVLGHNKNFENVLKDYAAFAPKRYTYSDIKKMTNSLAEKLGEGGFGGAYKGKLLDGRLVAVKLLKNSKGDGEGFINEVVSIGRTNHVNVVTLLGFCLEGHKRALVYEYMANGSLEKFRHGKANIEQTLPLETLFQIVLGIARGLEYLHRGCKTRILHFDIKPHNILLDEEFRPKISDFGLAKLIPQDKQSKISMSGARGTIGYIAPEVFNRTFGDVSHKSDVYSYGMMVLEVIGSRIRANTQAESSSDLYFPEYIYKQLERGQEVEIGIAIDENDNKLKRKMIVVSLWCIQPVPSSRPSMSKVVQMLEGSSEAIEIPHMPAFSSPPSLHWDLETSSITSLI